MARVGGARVFFDVVGQFQASRLINDAAANATILAGLFMDAGDAIFQSFSSMFDQIDAALEDVMESFIKFEKQLVRVRKFYGGITAESDAFAASAVELGHAFGFAGEESLQAAAKMAQLKNILGSQEAVIAGTEMGLAFAAIGEMETEAAMNRLINLGQQTGFIYGELTKKTFDMLSAQQQADVVRQNSIRVLDQLNTVENSSVATMEQITFTLNQYAAQGNLAGESIGEMAAMSALLIESGEESTRAGTGMRMMYQRLANDGSGASKAISEYVEGIDEATIRQMSLTEVMGHLSSSWETMNQEQKQNLAITVGGGRHYVKFLKIMENHSRLVQLQGEAYRATYPAIDELNERLNSSFMTLNRLNAEVEDTKVRIGEDLAGAYVYAAAMQQRFWLQLEEQMDKDLIKNLAERLTLLNQTFQIIKPIADFGLSLISLLISFSTLRLIIRAMRGDIDYLSQSYLVAAQANAYKDQIAMQSVKVTEVQIASITHLARKELHISDLRYFIAQRRWDISRQSVEAEQSALVVQREMLALQGNVTVAQQADLFARGTKVTILRAEEVGMRALFQARIMEHDALRKRHFDFISQSASAEVMRTRSVEMLNKQTLAQHRLNEGLDMEHQRMADEIILTAPLDAATKKRLNTILLEIITNQEKVVGLKAVERGYLTLRLAEEGETETIRKRIAVLDAELVTMKASRSEIENLILADIQLAQATEASTVAIQATGIAAIKTAVSQYTMRNAISAANKSLMMLSVVGMLFTDKSKGMRLTMAAMAGMMITTLIPAIKWTDLSVKKLAISVTAATGGLNLIIGAAVALAAYFASETIFSGMGMSDEELTNLYEVEQSLSNINTVLNDLASKKDERILPSAIGVDYGDVTFGELVGDPAKATEVANYMSETIAGLTDDLATAKKNEDDILVTSLSAQLSMWNEHYDDIEKINSSHQARQQAIDEGALSDQEILVKQHAAALEKGITQKGGSLSAFGSDQVSPLHGLTGFSKYGFHAGGEIFKYRREAQAHLDSLLDITSDTNQAIIDDFRDTTDTSLLFWNDMLDGFESAEEARVETVISANDAIMQEMESFTNNREELFWGSRENFTGALYKTIQQGQVENLLYKTEIMQTNNFYGISIDEAIERVSIGVLDNLRMSGVDV